MNKNGIIGCEYVRSGPIILAGNCFGNNACWAQ